MQRPRIPMPPSARGVVDLSALGSAKKTAASGGGAAGGGGGGDGVVIDVTEASFQSAVVDRSSNAPVVIDFWATWCEPCKQLSPILERLAEEYAGRFVLARIDVDANQNMAAQFGVQGIPAVLAVVAGQLVPLFQGALPEAQVRQYIDQLLLLAEQRFGIKGTATEGGQDEELQAPSDPAFEAAYQALQSGDIDGAARAFDNVLSSDPNNADAKAGLAQVELLRRTRDVDAQAVRAAAAERLDDVDAQCAVADLDMAGGHVEDAIRRLVETVARTSGEDRDRARTRLLDYFAMLGPEDPRVISGRTALTRVLF